MAVKMATILDDVVFALGSAHVKFDVWTEPNRHFYSQTGEMAQISSWKMCLEDEIWTWNDYLIYVVSLLIRFILRYQSCVFLNDFVLSRQQALGDYLIMHENIFF